MWASVLHRVIILFIGAFEFRSWSWASLWKKIYIKSKKAFAFSQLLIQLQSKNAENGMPIRLNRMHITSKYRSLLKHTVCFLYDNLESFRRMQLMWVSFSFGCDVCYKMMVMLNKPMYKKLWVISLIRGVVFFICLLNVTVTNRCDYRH